MVDEDPKPASDAQIEQEIREGRKFGMEEAMARMAGPGHYYRPYWQGRS